MNQEQMNNKMLEVSMGEQASAVLTYLEDWLEAYHEWIINNLKTCSEDRLRDLRNLLVVSEDFKGFLEQHVVSGKLAGAELREALEREEFNKQRGYYPE